MVRLGRVATLVVLLLAAGVACDRKTEPEGTDPKAVSRAPAEASVPDGAPVPLANFRLPDWSFDAEDPARDYVGRYVRATQRYGDQTACVQIAKSTFRDGETLVDVKNPPDGTCGTAGQTRDTFVANVSADRLKLLGSEAHAPLRPWPDGSLPNDPPNAVAEMDDLHKWKAPLRQAIKAEQLFPLRVQLYGRGTYPVVSIAGWHALFDPKGDIDALKPAVARLCAASNGQPMGFMAGMDRSLVLRADCPDRPRWEKLGQ